MTWADKHKALQETLHLRNNPIGIAFSNSVPPNIKKFQKEYPEPKEDGRTGAVSAGCEFWIYGTETTFYTDEADHGNCSVGSVTHGFKNWDQVLSNSDVATVLECKWVSEADVPHIKILSEKYEYVTYGPLKDYQSDPDVVFIRINAEQLMRMKDAFPDIRIEGKPQCHIIPIAKEEKIPAISTGCALSRKRTGMSSNELSATIPVAIFDDVLEQLQRTAAIDDMVGDYAKNDKQRFNN